MIHERGMAGRFILSLDCEGKWGVADCLTPRLHRELSGSALQSAYRAILALLDEYDVPATFAFVGLFGETAQHTRRLLPLLRKPAYASFLGDAVEAIGAGQSEGWDGAWAVDEVLAGRAGHELALHGVTHIPWDRLDDGQAQAEMNLLAHLVSPVRSAKTFVYPRNRVAHAALLSDYDIVGYREAPPARSRPAALAQEFNPFIGPQHDPIATSPIPIPSGQFVNWRHGLRRLVPAELSLRRTKRMLRLAAEQGGVVHYWLHPENVATAPATLALLREMLAAVVEARNAGECVVMTQYDYCRAIARGNALRESRPAD
jgi:peptidoglycan/xylan/chitin deacetylase (PgdA/CDA1 family)